MWHSSPSGLTDISAMFHINKLVFINAHEHKLRLYKISHGGITKYSDVMCFLNAAERR